jgi:hypothetical protein
VREPSGYATPTAFRRALSDRLKALASGSRWPLPQLQRQIAYDRLLERLYLADDQWIVKGATALPARDLGVRATIDVDLYRPQAGQNAEAQLRAAAQRDIGDWFRFEIGPAQQVTAGTTSRLPVTAVVGATVWVSFHVDLAGDDLQMTGRPDHVPPLARVLMPGIQQHGYRAYPLVDHIADKLAAMFERHGTLGAPSTRYKDLVDLVAILTRVSVEADSQQQALESEAERRGFILPGQFDVPDHQLWVTGYRAEARRSLLTIARTLDEATGIVRPFADPLLARTAAGQWEPTSGRWTR